jgi:hypothetical protein
MGSWCAASFFHVLHLPFRLTVKNGKKRGCSSSFITPVKNSALNCPDASTDFVSRVCTMKQI